MKAVLAGAGARRALRPGAQGTVLASLARACYLDLPGGLAALVGPDAHPGPLHLVLDSDVPRVEDGAPVTVAGDGLLLAGLRVDLRGTAAWDGALPPPPLVLERTASVLEAVTEAASGSALHVMGQQASRGVACLGNGDLEQAAALLAGLGPGLTPAGDDALAGAVFAVRAACGPSVEARLEQVVTGLPTGAISLAFLTWAGRGQALAPVHDILAAAVRNDSRRAALAARTLAGVGASSGADFALGLCSALQGLYRGAGPVCQDQRETQAVALNPSRAR